MSFLSPMAFFFAAALPVVVVFYLLKRRRVVRLISSTLLWERFLSETQASAPFQKLRHNWLLILQLLLLALVVFALARPYFAGELPASRLRVVVLDASASMQSRDVQPSRFEQARGQALEWVDSLEEGQQLVLLVAAANTEVKQSATGDKAALRRALLSCEVTDGPTRLVEAFKLAATLTHTLDDAEIHLFSDGVLPDLDEFEYENLPLVYHRIGERGDNVGVVSMDVRANPEDPSKRAVFANVVNYSGRAHRAEVELAFGGDPVEVRVLDLEPTNSLPLVFIVGQTNDGIYSVRLKVEDDLEADNQASLASLMPRPVKALLVTAGNRLFEKALRASGSVELEVAPFLSGPAGGYDLVVLDDVVPTVWPEVNTLAVHVASTNLFPDWQTLPRPVIVDWRNNHPLLRFVNFDNVSVAEAIQVKTPPWGVALVEAAAAPLMVAGELNRSRVVWLAFDTLESTWPLELSFPIFVANAVEWLNPASANASQLMVRAGEPFRLSLAQEVVSAHVVKPNGERVEAILQSNSRDLIFGDTARQGLYRLEAGTNSVTFCVNLMDGEESDTKPRDALPVGRYGRVEALAYTKGNRELWRWIAAAGLAMLLFEWWFYHRRTA